MTTIAVAIVGRALTIWEAMKTDLAKVYQSPDAWRLRLSCQPSYSTLTIEVLCFFFDGFFSKVIALPTIVRAIVVALSQS